MYTCDLAWAIYILRPKKADFFPSLPFIMFNNPLRMDAIAKDDDATLIEPSRFTESDKKLPLLPFDVVATHNYTCCIG